MDHGSVLIFWYCPSLNIEKNLLKLFILFFKKCPILSPFKNDIIAFHCAFRDNYEINIA